MKKWGSLDGFEVYWVYTTQKNHETHVSFVSDLILSHYCITDRWYLSKCINLKNFLLVEKKWDSLDRFEVYGVYTTRKNQDTHVSYVSDLKLSHFCSTDWLLLCSTLNNFLLVIKKGATMSFLKSIGSRQVKKSWDSCLCLIRLRLEIVTLLPAYMWNFKSVALYYLLIYKMT